MNSKEDQVQIGRVIKPHGIRGEVVVDPSTDDPHGRFAKGTVLRGVQTGKELQLTVKTMRPHQQRLLISFEETPGRNEAEHIRGLRFYADPIEEDEAYYDHELEGLRVLNVGPVSAEEAEARAYEGATPEPEDIGAVTSVLRTPAHRLLVVGLDNGGEATLPFVHEIVPIVDLDNEAIVITPPDGLLEL
ncbi:ribosome maturation factor RimM [Corynebacterium gerontici]|uniref:Ribosome maturation factor RimM n=1 Tax=Corynebacterium gerontici TaxID=2079234 RepID=A0A3G6J195_9CORY|nr:ribosome maturation factor RimM [Corynebacterium gerontici]AZA11696.1 Ribosome maturation factor RimM [Corynebacterium gerontici]